jgi:hypothetical protein
MHLGVTESDGFAIAMIAILGTSFSFVLVIIVGIVRHARKSASEPEDPIEEPEVQPAGDNQKETKPEPWEKPADWWQKGS